MWQHCQPNARRMPSAAEICEGKSERIGWLIAEVYEMFVLRDMRSARRSIPMMKWYSGVLSHYGIVLNRRTNAPPFSGKAYRDASWNSFRSGTVLACVLHYFCGCGDGGGSALGGRTGLPPMDLSRIWFQPKTAREFHDNVAVVFEVMLRLRMPLLWTVDNFIAFPDEDFLLWQLHALYLMFRDQPCGLAVFDAEDFQHEEEAAMTGQHILVDNHTGIAEVKNIMFRDSVFSSKPVDDELVGRGNAQNSLRGLMPGGNIAGSSPSNATRYDAAGIMLDGEDVSGWSESTLPNDRVTPKRVSNFGMDAMKTNDEVMALHATAQQRHHPHRAAPHSPPPAEHANHPHSAQPKSILIEPHADNVGMSKPAELPVDLMEHANHPHRAPPKPTLIESETDNVGMSKPTEGGPGTMVWDIKYGAREKNHIDLLSNVVRLQEERLMLEKVAETIHKVEPKTEQDMYDACRLTELRLMCIEEERRLTVMVRGNNFVEGTGIKIPEDTGISKSLTVATVSSVAVTPSLPTPKLAQNVPLPLPQTTTKGSTTTSVVVTTSAIKVQPLRPKPNVGRGRPRPPLSQAPLPRAPPTNTPPPMPLSPMKSTTLVMSEDGGLHRDVESNSTEALALSIPPEPTLALSIPPAPPVPAAPPAAPAAPSPLALQKFRAPIPRPLLPRTVMTPGNLLMPPPPPASPPAPLPGLTKSFGPPPGVSTALVPISNAIVVTTSLSPPPPPPLALSTGPPPPPSIPPPPPPPL